MAPQDAARGGRDRIHPDNSPSVSEVIVFSYRSLGKRQEVFGLGKIHLVIFTSIKNKSDAIPRCIPRNRMKRSRVEAIANGIFLILLGFLFYFNWWWPGILVAVWASLATRQVLSGRMQDLLLSTFLLGSLFIVAYFQLSWNLMTPILFVLGGLYIILREFYYDDDPSS